MLFCCRYNRDAITKTAMKEGLMVVSAKNVAVGFWGAPFGSEYGVYGATPPEILHQFDIGLCNKAWSFLISLLKLNCKNGIDGNGHKRAWTKVQEELDQRLMSLSVRHSVPGHSKVRFPNGASRIPYMRANEYPNLVLQLALILGVGNDTFFLPRHTKRKVVRSLMMLVTLRRKLWMKAFALSELHVLRDEIAMYVLYRLYDAQSVCNATYDYV